MIALTRQLIPRHVLPRLRIRATCKFFGTLTNPTQPFEEEQLPWYRPDQFYPAHVGEILDTKYKIVGKLGYGAYSTVWLCRNLRCVCCDWIAFFAQLTFASVNGSKGMTTLSPSKFVPEMLAMLNTCVGSFTFMSMSVHLILRTLANLSFVGCLELSNSPALPGNIFV